MELSKIHDISILHLFGEISFLEIDQIEKVLESLKQSAHAKVLLDMASVDHMHYRVVKNLVEQAANLQNLNGDLKVANLKPHIKDVFRFTGADQYLEDYATISEAVLSFIRPSGVVGEVMQ